jgi:outer membrane protein, adhesin transport system
MKQVLLIFVLLILTCSLSTTGIHAEEMSADGLPLALQLAVTRHPAVTSKAEELKALGFDLESAQSQRYPTLQLQATSTSEVAGSTASNSDQYYTVVAVAKQPLWVGGRIDGSIDQANVKLKLGKLALMGVQRQLMESTVAAYSSVLGSRKRLEAAGLNVQEHLRLRTLIERREGGGIASQADVQLARSRLSQALAQQIQIEAVLQSAQNDLLALTQQPLQARLTLDDRYALLPAQDRIAAAAEAASATVQQRLVDVELARTASDLASAAMMPSLYAKLEQDLYTSNRYGEVPQGTRLGLVVEGSLEGLGFSGWKKVRSSLSRVDAAKREVEVARNELRRQIATLLSDLQSMRRVEESYMALVKSTEETLASFMRQYDAGRKSWVDVLNTQRELSDARLTLEQTRSTVLEKRLRLAVQVGVLDLQAGVVQ